MNIQEILDEIETDYNKWVFENDKAELIRNGNNEIAILNEKISGEKANSKIACYCIKKRDEIEYLLTTIAGGKYHNSIDDDNASTLDSLI